MWRKESRQTAKRQQLQDINSCFINDRGEVSMEVNKKAFTEESNDKLFTNHHELWALLFDGYLYPNMLLPGMHQLILVMI